MFASAYRISSIFNFVVSSIIGRFSTANQPIKREENHVRACLDCCYRTSSCDAMMGHVSGLIYSFLQRSKGFIP